MNLRKKKGKRTSDLRVRKLWSRTLAMILCMCMVLGSVDMTVFAEEEHSSGGKQIKVITAFEPLDNSLAVQYVTVGDSESAISFPEELNAVVELRSEVMVDENTETKDETPGGNKETAADSDVTPDTDEENAEDSDESSTVNEETTSAESSDASVQSNEEAVENEQSAENEDSADDKEETAGQQESLPQTESASQAETTGAQTQKKSVSVQTENVQVAVAWELDASASTSGTFDSTASGNTYVYKPVLNEEYNIAEGTQLPKITVIIEAKPGESQVSVDGLTASLHVYDVKQSFDDLNIDGEDIITEIKIMDTAGVELTPDMILTDGMKLRGDYHFDLSRAGHTIVVGDTFGFKIPGWAQFITTPFTVEIMEDDDTDGTPVARITVDSLGTDGYYPARIEILKLKTRGGTKDWTQLIHFWFEFQLDVVPIRKQIHDWDTNTGIIGMDVGILQKPSFRFDATITPQLLKAKQGSIDTVAGGKATITWTVDLQPDTAEGIGGASFQQVILTDVIPDGQDYVAGSLKHDDGTGVLTELSDTDPGVRVEGKTLTLNAGILWGGPDGKLMADRKAYRLQYQTIMNTGSLEELLEQGGLTASNRIVANYQYKKALTDTAMTDQKEEKTATTEKKYVKDSVLQKTGPAAPDGTGFILWELVINQDELSGYSEDILLYDTLPQYMELIAGKYLFDWKVTSSHGGTDTVLTGTDTWWQEDGSVGDGEDKRYKITIRIPKEKVNGNKITIHYKTKCDLRASAIHNGYDFINEVEGKIGPLQLNKKTARVQRVSQGAVIAQQVRPGFTYSAKEHTIEWEITAHNYIEWTGDPNGYTLPSFSIGDEIPEGWEFVSATYTKTKKGEVPGTPIPITGAYIPTPGASGRVTLIEEKGLTEKWDYVFTVTIRLKEDPAHSYKWAGNFPGEDVVNTAYLIPGYQSTVVKDSYKVQAKQRISSKMAAKAAVDTDHTEHTITWKITLNQNQLQLTGAKIEDQMPDGMVYVDGSIAGVTAGADVSVDPLLSTGQTIVFQVTGAENREVEFTYKTKIIDDELLKKNESWKPLNRMWLTGEVPDQTGTTKIPLQRDKNYAEAAADYKEEMISKRHMGRVGNRIPYQVDVNTEQVSLRGVVLVDTLPSEYMVLVPDTVRLVELTITDPPGGAGIIKTEKPGTASTPTVSVNVDEGNYSIVLGDINKAYRVTFDVVVLEECDLTAAVNRIAIFEKQAVLTEISANAVNAVWSRAGGSSAAYRKYMVHKPNPGGGTPGGGTPGGGTPGGGAPEGGAPGGGTPGGGTPGGGAPGGGTPGGGAPGRGTPGGGTPGGGAPGGGAPGSGTMEALEEMTSGQTASGRLPKTGGFLGTAAAYAAGAVFLGIGCYCLFIPEYKMAGKHGKKKKSYKKKKK